VDGETKSRSRAAIYPTTFFATSPPRKHRVQWSGSFP
jgi:hypothetical protein